MTMGNDDYVSRETKEERKRKKWYLDLYYMHVVIVPNKQTKKETKNTEASDKKKYKQKHKMKRL